MSRQATKFDLEAVLSELGVSFDGKPTVTELREWIHTEFGKLHCALAVLGYGDSRLGTHANQTRLRGLYDAAARERAQQQIRTARGGGT